MPKIEFNYQYGQYNSIQKDNEISVQQSIPFPTYYSAQSHLYKAELQSSELLQQTTVNEITTQVKLYYYQILYL